MKLKTLAVVVAVLAVLSAATWYARRPAPEAPGSRKPPNSSSRRPTAP
jgi:hypothetical protein